jgi:hypothetical protein
VVDLEVERDREQRVLIVIHTVNTKHEAHKDLYWFGPLESKTLRPVLGGDCILDDHVGWLRWSALEGRPKPPYIGR